MYCKYQYYIDTSVNPHLCKPCPANCAECSSATNCTVCKGLFKPSNGACICDTSSYTYALVGGDCYECNFICKYCENNNQNTCKKIGTPDVPNPHTSEFKSLPNVYDIVCKQNYERNKNNICGMHSCHPTCQSCYSEIGGPAEKCSSCRDPYPGVNQGSLLNGTKSGNCYCAGGGLYGFNEHYFCAPCHPRCGTCSSLNYKQCLTCSDSGAIATTCDSCSADSNGRGRYMDPVTYACKLCHGSCLTCRGPAYNQCLDCRSGELLQNNLCGCPEGKFRSPVTNLCEPCQSPCVNCGESATKCKSCQPTALYSPGVCYCDGGKLLDGLGICFTPTNACHSLDLPNLHWSDFCGLFFLHPSGLHL
jgi:proprotein convertase subtilisin/kexin type 5